MIWLFIKKLCTISPHLTLLTACWNCGDTIIMKQFYSRLIEKLSSYAFYQHYNKMMLNKIRLCEDLLYIFLNLL